MPIYEYQCTACDATFEELVRSEAAARQVVCPQCGAHDVARRPSVFNARNAPTKRAPGCETCHNPGGPCPMAG